MEQASGPVSANAALLLGNVGFVLHQQGRPANAVPFFRRTVERRRQVHGDSSMHVAWPLFALGEALRDLGVTSAKPRPPTARASPCDVPSDQLTTSAWPASWPTRDGTTKRSLPSRKLYRSTAPIAKATSMLWALLRNLITNLQARGQFERARRLRAELEAVLAPDDPRCAE